MKIFRPGGIAATVALCAALFLAACSSDSDGGGGGGGAVVTPPAASASVSGTAMKGTFSNGTARAYVLNANGTTGGQVGSTAQLTPTGQFTINLGDYAGPVVVEVTGGTYRNEATGTNVAQSRPLRTVIANVPASGTVTSTVTPLTHIAAARATARMATNQPVASAVASANSEVGNYFGVPNVTGVTPADLSNGAATPGSAAANYGAVLAGLARLAGTIGAGVAPDALADALATDASDGDFDGVNGLTPVTIGGTALPSTAAQADLANAITQFMGSAQNASGVSANDVQTLTSTISSNAPDTRRLTHIMLAPASVQLSIGGTQVFSATGQWSDGSLAPFAAGNLTWTSSNGGAVTVLPSGIAIATNGGQSTIRATETGGTVFGEAMVTVVNPIVSIAIAPLTPTIPQGDTQQFSATATFANNSTANVTNMVTWSSSDQAVATINAQGLAASVGAGTTTIRATDPATQVTQSTTLTVQAVPTAVEITPLNPTIAAGSNQQMTATLRFSDNTSQDVTGTVVWASLDDTVATVSGTGLVAGIAIGQTTITATHQASNLSNMVTVTVNKPIVSIAVTPVDPAIDHNQTVQFTATATYSDTTTGDVTSLVTWSSSNTNAASVDNAGLATGSGHGTTTITATDPVSQVAGTSTLVVNPILVSVAVTPSPTSVTISGTRQMTATGTRSDSTTFDLTGTVMWTSSDTNLATVSPSGLVSGIAEGQVTITATEPTSNLMGTANVSVSNPIVSIAVTPNNPQVNNGANQQFTATATFSNQTTMDVTPLVTWSSSATAIMTVNAQGVGTAVGHGLVTITARDPQSAAVFGTTLVTVVKILSSIAVTPTNSQTNLGSTRQFTATGTYSDATTANISTTVLWASSQTGVMTISATGLGTTVGEGTTSISASLDGKQGSTNATVIKPLISIAVTPANPTIAPSATQQFIATGTFSDSSTQILTTGVTWTSSNTARATINASTGLASGVSAGTTTITATSGSVSGNTTLTVSAPTLVSITITPSSPNMTVGNSQQFTATGNYSDSSTQNLTSQVTWSSTNSNVLVVENTTSGQTGEVKGQGVAVASGSANVTATFSSITGNTTVNITGSVSYSNHIQPIFNTFCTSCHGGSGNYFLTSYAQTMTGGRVQAGNPGASLLMTRINGGGAGLMPQGGPALKDARKALISNWIQAGANNN